MTKPKRGRQAVLALVITVLTVTATLFSQLLLTIPVQANGADWWNPVWPYRKAVLVDNTANPQTLTNYQIWINITAESEMRYDFGDLRFVQNDTLLDYWINATVGGSYASVWIEVATIPASTTTLLHMYYGNPAAPASPPSKPP